MSNEIADKDTLLEIRRELRQVAVKERGIFERVQQFFLNVLHERLNRYRIAGRIDEGVYRQKERRASALRRRKPDEVQMLESQLSVLCWKRLRRNFMPTSSRSTITAKPQGFQPLEKVELRGWVFKKVFPSTDTKSTR